MALRHHVFVECSRECADVHNRDVFLAMAYGLYPMCVAEDPADSFSGGRRSRPGTGILLFRRSLGPTEKDRVARLAAAAAELQTDPDIAWYNTTTASPLHVHAPTLAVSWEVGASVAEVQLRVVPALLRWTRWEKDAAWAGMRLRLAALAEAPRLAPLPRTLRLAQLLELVGQRAGADAVVQCRRAVQRFAAGTLPVTYDPVTGDVTSVDE